MTSPNPVDQPFRRLFAGFDRDVEPPADLATRLRLRVLAQAELDGPMAVQPVLPPVQAANVAPGAFPGVHPPALGPRTPDPVPASVLPPPSSRPAEARGRRRQPWWLLAAEIAASLLLLMGAAVVVIQRTVDADRSAPRLGSSITAVASPSSEPQLLWERTDPDLMGTSNVAAGDDLLVRPVQDEHKSGFLWWERYEYEHFLQGLDRRTGEQRWLIPVDHYGTSYMTETAVLFISYPTPERGAPSLIAFAHADGTELWRIELPSPPAYSPDLPVRGNVVFLATYDAHVRAYDLTTGAEVWATAIGAPPAGGETQSVAGSSLTLDGDRLLTLDTTGAVVEIDAASGAITTTRPASVSLPKVVYGGQLLVTADRLVTVMTGTDDELPDDGAYTEENHPRVSVQVSAIDRATGGEAWSTELTSGSAHSFTQADGRLVLWLFDEFGRETPSTIRVLNLGTGAEEWTTTVAGVPNVGPEQATTADGQLLFGTQSGEVVALDLATGAELWRYKVGDHVMMPPVVTGGLAVVGDAPDHLVAIAIPEHGG